MNSKSLGKKPMTKAVSSKKPSQAASHQDPFGKSDIDEFIDKKNKVTLSTSNDSRVKRRPAKEEVLSVDVSEEEYDDDEEDDDDEYNYDDEDEEEDDDDDIKLDPRKKTRNLDLDNKMSWGKEKESFYTQTHDDEDVSSLDEEEEETEAKELQKQRNKFLRDEDYQDDESFNKLINAKKTKETKRSADPEEKILETMNKELSSIDFGNNHDIEKLQKNMSTFTKKEKLDYLMSESPLLFELLEEFKSKVAEIRFTLLPVLEKVRASQLPTSKGISFLETKYHLLLSYCLNITYFLMLKASGASIKDHPVVDQLIKIRVTLEKIKPLDNKLQYQIEKILKTATLGEVSVSKDDPLQFRPNMGALADGDDDDEDEETRLMNDAGLYQAPRTSADKLAEDEATDRRKNNRDKKNKQKAVRSSMAKFIEEEYGDAPEELADDIDNPDARDSEDDEVREYEENNFVRITQSKKDKKLENKKKRISSGLEDLADFNDLSGIIETAEDREMTENKEYLKKKRMAQLLNNLNQVGANKRARGGDDDVPLAESKKRNQRDNRAQQQQDDDDEELPSDNEDDEYDGVPRNPNADLTNYADHAEGKRKITRQIEVNRGLTRSRPRESRTPHLRNRNKYEKAVKKLDSKKTKVDRQDASYAGVPRINTKTVKSQSYLH
eukprot:gene1135-1297_t